MLTRISEMLLLVALLWAFVASSAPAFSKGSVSCECYNPCFFSGGKNCKKPTGTCKFDATASFQCVSNNCSTYCQEIITN
jgi:hypothetical protein